MTESHVVPVANAGPAVMLLCAQYGIDPTKVSSTGPKGLLKTDIMNYIKENNLTALKVTTVKADKVKVPTAKADKVPKVEKKLPPTAVGTGAYTDIPLTSMRAVIAKRLSQSKSTSPHGYSTAECNIDAINAIRQGTIHILRKHFYSTKLNLTSQLFTKTGVFRQSEEFLFQHYILTKFLRCCMKF